MKSSSFYADGQALNMAAIASEIDMQGRHIQLANTVLQEPGEGPLPRAELACVASWYVSPSLTLADTVLAELTRPISKALSLGIDRARSASSLGLGVPANPCRRRGTLLPRR